MPAHAPDSVMNPDQRQLYRDISRVYGDYCGPDEEQWPKRQQEFIEILELAETTLRANKHLLARKYPRSSHCSDCVIIDKDWEDIFDLCSCDCHNGKSNV